jgi:hypothetical protein
MEVMANGCMTNGGAVTLWPKRKTKKTGNGEGESAAALGGRKEGRKDKTLPPPSKNPTQRRWGALIEDVDGFQRRKYLL